MNYTNLNIGEPAALAVVNAISVTEETMLLSANAVKETSAAIKPELQPPLAEDSGEWEGFYDDDEYEEF